jgi:hypothetical protein
VLIAVHPHPLPASCCAPQITTFEEVWPLLKAKGVYMCEDTSTSMVRAAPATSDAH